MAGVSRSIDFVYGAQCDETGPECQQCVKKSIECPGHHHPLKSRIQKPRQTQQRDREPRRGPSQILAGKRKNQPLLIPRPTIDETIAPNLAYEALSTQTKESFYGWLRYHFPRVHSSFSFRADVCWMDFIRSQTPSTCLPALLCGIRALITLQMGTLQGSKETIYRARHLYGRGIYHLRSLLQSPSALSDESLAACILLGGYEILDGNCENSWISHTRGIHHIMRARGPLAHKSGMGRTLMLCFRPFLLAESLVLGEPCFLGSSDWTSMTDDISSNEGQTGKGGRLNLIMDHVFNETAKCPGYYASTQFILLSRTDPASSLLDGLLTEISGTKDHLLKLQDKLDINHEKEAEAPVSLVNSMTQLTLDGLRSALALLDQLSTLLESDQKRRLAQHQTSLIFGPRNTDPWGLFADRSAVRIKNGPPRVNYDPTAMSSTTKPIGDWLDRFSLVMGMANISGSGSQ
ncbi:hypothetical protein BDW59DRAFT_64399 [Aspergillus cavernicola]|uniref:Zn(2)-C6 fungal-type domain-containing protein n=1 Tax=Aspergillus cavernicola TaxID=176166 RepID=A0ABR4J188_9EURO